jgi:hypothetical protein
VRLRRLRTGERIALPGAVALALLLLVSWSHTPGPDGGAGHGPGVVVMVLVLLAVLATAAALTATARTEGPGLPVVLMNAAVPVALIALIAVVVRMAWGTGVATAGAFGALVAAAVLLGGLWHALADERTDTDEARAQTQRALAPRGAPRPVPALPADVTARDS